MEPANCQAPLLSSAMNWNRPLNRTQCVANDKLSHVRATALVLSLVALISPLGCRQETRELDSSDRLRPSLEKRFEIVSSSMSPTFLGATRRGICTNCNETWEFAAETFSDSLPARCYCCGGLCEVAEEVHSGDQVRLVTIGDKMQLNRFDLVAIKTTPGSAIQTKRVWGLPGEEIQISQGELWVGGTLLRKSIKELKQLSIELLDPSTLKCGNHSSITSASDRATLPVLPINIAPAQPFVWKSLVPARVHPRESEASKWRVEEPLSDDHPLNQGVSYRTMPASDVMLNIGLERDMNATLRIRWSFQLGDVEILLLPTSDFGNSFDARDKRVATVLKEESVFVGRCRKIGIAICDGRILVRSDKLTSDVAVAIQASDAPLLSELSSTLKLGGLTSFSIATAKEVSLTELRLSRDIVLRSNRRDPSEPQRFQRLGKDEYLVLGDNQPVSIDSRNGLGVVGEDQIVGKVLAALP